MGSDVNFELGHCIDKSASLHTIFDHCIAWAILQTGASIISWSASTPSWTMNDDCSIIYNWDIIICNQLLRVPLDLRARELTIGPLLCLHAESGAIGNPGTVP